MIIVHFVLWAIEILIVFAIVRALYRRLPPGRLRAILAVAAIPVFPLALLLTALALRPGPPPTTPRPAPVVTPYNPLAEWERSLADREAAKVQASPKPESAAHLAFANTQAVTGRASVIDGDTLDIRGTRIRLYGIDAPESAQTCTKADGRSYRCGQTAALALSDRIGSATVSCAPRDTDRYGRTVAVCRLGDQDLNAWLVESGLAVAYRQYSFDYVAAEGKAKAAKIGLWAGPFILPWEWRSARRR